MRENPAEKRAHRIESQRIWRRIIAGLAAGGAAGAADVCAEIVEKGNIKPQAEAYEQTEKHQAATAEAREVISKLQRRAAQRRRKTFSGWSPPNEREQ